MPRGRARLLVVVAVCLAAALAAAAAARLRGREVAAVAVARAELVQTVVATGRVAPLARVEIGSLLAGTVVEVTAREGDPVEPGQALVRLRDDAERAAVGQARAGVAQAEAAVAQAAAAVAQAEARLRTLRTSALPSAEQSVRIAAADLEAARREFARVEPLVAQGMLARAELDEARRALETAQGRLERETVVAAASRPGGSAEQEAEAAAAQAASALALAKAASAQARAALAGAEARLADTVLRAPAAGTVVVRAVEEGDTVAPGRALLTLARPGRTEVVAPVDERNLALLAPGQPALVSADAYPGRSFRATLSTVVPAVVAASGTVTARFAVPDPPAYLLPDMTVSVEVEVARAPGALTLPLEAVRDAAGDPWVLVVRGGRAVRQAVRLGVRGAGRVQVAEGLAAGELVVPPAAGAAAGDRVRARAAGA